MNVRIIPFILQAATENLTSHFFSSKLFYQLTSALFLLFVPWRLWKLNGRQTKTIPSPIYMVKLMAAHGIVGVQLALLVLWVKTPQRTSASVPASVLGLVVSLTLTHIVISDNSPLAAALTVSTALKAITLVLECQSKISILKPEFSKQGPEATTGVIGWSFLWWLNSLFKSGFRKLLTYGDLFELDEALKSNSVKAKMIASWEEREKPETKSSLPFACIRAFRWPLLSVLIPRAALIGFSFAQPFLVTRCISLLSQAETHKNTSIGYGLIAATFLIYVGIAISTVHYEQRWYRTSTMLRGGLICLIYEKTLYIQDEIYSDSAAITLMSTDVDSALEALHDINEIWARMIEVSIGIWLLTRQIGAISIVPIILVLLSSIVQGPIAKSIIEKRLRWNQTVQRRIAVTSSMIDSMKSAKILGLQNHLHRTIQTLRLKEISAAVGFFRTIIGVNVSASIPDFMSPTVTFIVYSVQAKIAGTDSLSTSQAFTSLAIIRLITQPATMLLIAIPQVLSTMACFGRIQQYLVCMEKSELRITMDSPDQASNSSEKFNNSSAELTSITEPTRTLLAQTSAIKFSNATIRPAPPPILPALHDVSIDLPASGLTMILGPVGSGKSTLIKAVLGELICDTGSSAVSSQDIAYCAQKPWLPNKSIRESICGLDKSAIEDEKWYRTVVKACALDQDIARLPLKDQSILGNKELILSGGQKQRVALARAVYARRPIILLDDVLSALDSRTEEVIVRQLIGPAGLFRRYRTTCILATHAIRHLFLADYLVVLTANGTIAQQGTYNSLKSLPGFVRDTLITVDDRKIESDITEEPSPESFNIDLLVPRQDALMDLTRQAGDSTIYKYYAKSIGKFWIVCILMAAAAFTFSHSFPQIWLSWWTSAGGGNLPYYLSIYAVLSASALVFLYLVIRIMFFKVMPRSAARLHEILLTATISATQELFAKTDAGEILNRFSQDMSLIDRLLPLALVTTITGIFQVVAQVALMSTGSSYMAITIPFTLLVLYFIQDVYLKTSRQIRFMDLEARSPLYTNFLETLSGLSTIRAFGWEASARAENMIRLDVSQRPYYLLYCIQRWLNLVLDLLVASLAVIIVALALSIRGSTSPSLLAVALINVLGFNQTLSQLVNQWTSLKISLGAIARVRSFERDTVSEDLEGEDMVLPETWPSGGGVEWRNVSARYNDTNLALDSINLNIAPGEKIGICGRTGSGKSSLLMTLLRLLDFSDGEVLIDGCPISRISRGKLRERMMAIPQDPFLLSTSVRMNVDPSGTVQDSVIINVLRKIGMWETIEGRGGLDADMMEQPLSHGQQQLFCLARVLVQKSQRDLKILLLDEATSSVDSTTDALMQKLIREEFSDCTIIVVAHRLDTVIRSDKIVVMEKGQIVEFDSPENLLAWESRLKQLYGSSDVG